MFSEILTSLESFVSSSAWASLPKTYPADYSGKISEETFLKFEVYLTGSLKEDYTNVTNRGNVVVQIYYPKDKSRRYASDIADSASAILSNQLLSSLQTFQGSLTFVGLDPKNSSLKRADLTIPFVHRGE